MNKPILCLDFDGVLHSYTSGWQGADVISDPPVPGSIAFLREAVKVFDVQIFSSRSHQEGGISAMRLWLMNSLAGGDYHEMSSPDYAVMKSITWPTEKPPAFLTIDDRSLLFTGTWPEIKDLINFKPWYSK
jgi:hypothetical protein